MRRCLLAVTLFSALVAMITTSTDPALAACVPAVARRDVPVALILSGGGAKGAYEAGVASAFLEGGLPIRLVAGSSAGAMNAVMVAEGRIERLAQVWGSITRAQVYRLRPSVVFSGLLPGWLTLMTLNAASSLLDPAPLRELLVSSLDLDRVRTSPIRVLVITTDLVQREKRLFDNDTITVDVLMAAAAVPGAFPPVKVDGQWLVDGGLTGRAPVLEALQAGVDVERAIVVMSYATEVRGEPPSSLRQVLEQAFETTMVHQITRDTELARLKYPRIDIQLLTPSAPLTLRPLDFDPAAITRAFSLGRADGTACLNAWGTSER